jgi:hypothetical protein
MSSFKFTLAAMLLTGMFAVAQSKVVVTNKTTEPVPTAAQGTTQVSGSVTVSNTPTVKVSALPAVSISGTPNVSISNLPLTNDGSSANAAVAFKSVDEDARQAVNIPLQCSTSNGAQTCSASFNVPAAKQLVIEYVSMFSFGFGSPNPAYAQITASAGGATGNYFIPRGDATPFSNTYVSSMPVRIYAGGGTTVTMTGVQAGNGATFEVALSGHYVDLP